MCGKMWATLLIINPCNVTIMQYNYGIRWYYGIYNALKCMSVLYIQPDLTSGYPFSGNEVMFLMSLIATCT